jgi:hypothetical protein
MFYVDLAGEYLAAAPQLEPLPSTPFGQLLQGSIAIHRAWKARGRGTADTVTTEGWQEWFAQLKSAGEYLTLAAKQDTNDPTPFALLQTVALGLQLDRRVAEAWLQQAVQRDPLHQGAHLAHLTLLCKKWGGSHEEMFAFARATSNRLPSGSTLHSIVFLAHQEYLLYVAAFDKDSAATKQAQNEKEVLDESIAIYKKSLYQRDRILQVSDYWPHNIAAWWFFVLKYPHIVHMETKKIGIHFTEFPWKIFYETPAEGYQRALRFAEKVSGTISYASFWGNIRWCALEEDDANLNSAAPPDARHPPDGPRR